ncbi:MAG: hybrid sensor histidine kinase/response regulator [Acidobacteria bacterium]|nr:MAG: hybrid sensor histidine kinase/response regulator [Acidobacteriota bacterium]
MPRVSDKKAEPSSLNGAGKKALKASADSSYVDPEQLLAILTAVSDGDFSGRLPTEKGIVGEIYGKLNEIIDKNHKLTSELGRISEVVGKEGKITERAVMNNAGGGWKSCIGSVNALITDLARPTTEVARVIGAVAQGDLSQNFHLEIDDRPLRGEFLRTGRTVNTMVAQLGAFASEVTRVAREVGTEGKLGGQAQIKGVSGTWKDLTENVNLMASNLTGQVRNIAEVTTAVANGDLSKKITVDVKGEILELKNTINTMVDQLSSFASEVTRVAREVGTEGKLGGQAEVKGVSGTWKDLTDNVNQMANNLTGQVRNIAEVTTAVANGDLSKKITVDVEGEILELKDTINTMVDQLSSFASEVTRVAREVGTEGKLGGEAEVEGVGGVWKDLTDNVNLMTSNLTGQVRNIAEVATAVANGDLSKKITVDVRGEILELKNTLNTMVDQLNSFASEVTRVAREVGTEGKLGGQAQVKGVSGTWKDLTDNVNFMASNLTSQVRNIAAVTTAVANGDLSKKITVDVQGEILELKDTINTMVDQLSSFASEVTRVAREVGTEGKLGGQAVVSGVSGTWKDLTDNVNFMASNLTSQVRNIADVTTAVANGDLSKKITVDVKGEILELKNTINTMVDQLSSFASEVTRVAGEVGTEGKLGGQAQVKGVSGTWKDLTENVNFMASNLTSQVRNIAAVTTAVANGDLSKKITVDVQGEILELKVTINTMVDQLNSFASEVTRVAREVGTEGKLGGQAQVKGVAGVWKDLTDNVNFMASNLTTQVRGIARVVTAVANGNLNRKLEVEALGEIAELADTINAMTDTLATFADQVTTVAREVGIEGELGGQASVPGASGTWRDLTDNVNQLAANLTNQVRAMADVATAVTKGDLTRSITVDASGEVAFLKDNVNEMIRNLRETTQKNTEQDWLKTNLAKFTRLLQGQRDLLTVARLILSEMAPLVDMQHGVFYITDASDDDTVLKLLASYAARKRKSMATEFQLGESLVGQCAVEKERIIIRNPPAGYVKINSALGEATPANIVVLPVLFEGQVKAVIELASFTEFNEIQFGFLDQLTESIGIVINTIEANMRTEELLVQSQSLAQELQAGQAELQETNRRLELQAQSLQTSEDLLKRQQEELQKTNQELEEKARLLSEQKSEVEQKNRQIELASTALEDKAKQLALSSKYKSEFLANMSHELRTPLNSMLILSKMLAGNPDNTLTEKQVEFAETIHSSGADLLALINEILDLSKIESGNMGVEISDVLFTELRDDIERNFRQIATDKGLQLEVNIGENVPDRMQTDVKRLRQVLKNLLSNAFKFTQQGKVEVTVGLENAGWSVDNPNLNRASRVVAFRVSDTGIGIAEDKQQLIFEAFQQEDGTTSRKYGGTGLGLSISREIARLLGGEIVLESRPGEGSTFTFYLPESYDPEALAPSTSDQRSNERDQDNGARPRSSLLSLSQQVFMDEDSSMVHVNVHDDRGDIGPDDNVLLIVENDNNFARLLMDVAHEKGFKCLVSQHGEDALLSARKFRPAAITLDLTLPGMHGYAVLDRLKHDPSTRHIPIQVISNVDDPKRVMRLGAFGHLAKPASRARIAALLDTLKCFVERKKKRLLIVEDDDILRNSITELLSGEDIEITSVGTAADSLEAVGENRYDCAIVDLMLPDMKWSDLIGRFKGGAESEFPVIVHTGKDLSKRETARIRKLAETIIIKDADSLERLLDETSLFLHRDVADLTEPQKNIIKHVNVIDPRLEGKKVLIVDDDIRNIFALTSVLERQKMQVVYAENGKDGIEMLRKTPGIDGVLMDIMMPEMDGFEAMKAIREIGKFKSVPIIAVTAKAMTGDRQKCLEAGASDYITKPVETEQLMSLLRIWLDQ